MMKGGSVHRLAFVLILFGLSGAACGNYCDSFVELRSADVDAVNDSSDDDGSVTEFVNQLLPSITYFARPLIVIPDVKIADNDHLGDVTCHITGTKVESLDTMYLLTLKTQLSSPLSSMELL